MTALLRSLALAFVICISVVHPALAQEKPYREGSVWQLTFVKLKPGMFDVYMQDAVVGRAREMAEAKKQGLVLSFKVLSGMSANREDWDILFMEEYKNWAALDGLSEKLAAIETKAHGTVERAVEAKVKRTDVREVVGEKMMQELIIGSSEPK
jgi:hypothetical protein